MTSEAVSEDVEPGTASPELVALVAKRELELSGKQPAAPVAAATKPKEPVGAEAEPSETDQAEEVEAGGKKDEKGTEGGKPDESKKALDVEWAKSDALKSRITTLYEAGHLDDDLLGLVRMGVERKEHLRAANKRFEESAEKVKSANAERDQYRERAERYDRLMGDPKFHAALHATEKTGGDEEVDPDLMTPAEKRDWVRKVAREDREAEDAKVAKSTEAEKARIHEIEGWAEDHKESLGSAVSDEDYEKALKASLAEMLEEDIDPRQVLTQRGLARRVNRVLERQREEKDVQGLRERVEGSKRDVVRSARASSPAGVRTEVGKEYPSTPAGARAKRVAETLAKYPLRPE